MPEDFIGYLLTFLGTSVLFVGALLTYRVGHRTVRATEARDANVRDDALITQYRGSWEAEVEARRRDREERELLATKVDGLHDKVDEYRAENVRFRAALSSAVGYIQRLLEILRALGAAHPPIPDDIAHFITDKP